MSGLLLFPRGGGGDGEVSNKLPVRQVSVTGGIGLPVVACSSPSTLRSVRCASYFMSFEEGRNPVGY